ncbi:hypothetical protein L1987_44629 [Smallanthus sonchifolius]|uniref:Uncharacterized protein n=1 Tax=Smallanthus sonchifolius TaxID=185202 RepID=A0ACB9GRA0_9ASTR|nr:hypothetical protein L1987_44629 [Smallanthus sonchifolius]
MEDYKSIIEAARSSSVKVKQLAAQSIPRFFKFFPGLSRSAVDVLGFMQSTRAWGFVFADVLVDPHQLLMVDVVAAFRAIGNEIEVYSLEDGPMNDVWKNIGVPVIIVEANNDTKIIIDWLNYDAILVNSFEAKDVISGFDVVIHFSGLKAVGESVKKPLMYYDNNITLLEVTDAKSLCFHHQQLSMVGQKRYPAPLLYLTHMDEPS